MACGEMYYEMLKEKRANYAEGEKIDSSKDYYDELNLILEKNLLTYHFQPIVDAKSGEIYAYEALMRTTNGINIPPLVLLETAYKYNKLYELEKMTLFGVMDYYVENIEKLSLISMETFDLYIKYGINVDIDINFFFNISR